MNKRIFKKAILNKGYQLLRVGKGFKVNNLVYVEFYNNGVVIEYAYLEKRTGVQFEIINLNKYQLQEHSTKSFIDNLDLIINSNNIVATIR